jgi:hypothetical protein
VLTIAIVAALGHWLDTRYWGGHGWGLGAGFLLGAAVAFRNLMRTGQQMQRDIERAEAGDPEAHKWTVDEGWLHGDPPAGSRRDGDVADSTHSDQNGAGSNDGRSSLD